MERSVAHLPGLAAKPEGSHRGETAAGAPFAAPRLSGADAREVAAAVREAALRARRERSIDAVLGALSRAAGRLADGGSAEGREARELLIEELGWTPDLARRTLEGMATTWTEDALRAVLRDELGEPASLDEFVPAPLARGAAGAHTSGEREPDAAAGAGTAGTRRRRALGPPLLFVVHAGNVPGVAVTAAVRGLLVRSGVLSKTSSGEPGLLALFARSLARDDALLGDCLATTWWPGEEPDAAGEAWVKDSSKVIVYGGDRAVATWRGRVPAHADVVAYGPRIGVAVVLPDADAATAARGVARDVCAYEQGGCVSPRLVYAVGRPAGVVAEAVAAALAEETSRRPPPAPSPAEATAIRALRAEAEFAGYAEPGSGRGHPDSEPLRVLASEGDLAWTVLAGGDPAPRSEGLPRVLRVHGVASPGRLEQLLVPLAGRIQAVGYAGEDGAGELAERAAALGVSRVAPVGSMAWPPADWRHDGRHQLLPLIQWTDWES